MEKEMTTYSCILAWRIPWTEEPGGYSPWDRKESDMTEQLLTHTHTDIHTYRHTHTQIAQGTLLTLYNDLYEERI